jgi:hypothetical protein
MDPKDKKYILENAGRKPPKEIARELGLKERKVAKLLEKHKSGQMRPKSGPAIIYERRISFSGWRIPSIVVIILIIAVGFGIYFNSLNNKFVFDDFSQITENTDIRDFGNLSRILTRNLGGASAVESKFYRPVQELTLMVDYHFWKLDRFGFHLTNTILHILACMLLFFVIRFVVKDANIAAVITLIYLVHPVHTEAVTYVSGRADSLAAIFLFLMMIFQYRYWLSTTNLKRLAYYILLFISFALALLSKELAVTFPILLIFFEYCMRKEDAYSGLAKKRALFYLPLVALIIIWFIVKNRIVSTETMIIEVPTVKATFLLAGLAIFDYIKLSFLPFNLHMEYKFPFPSSLFQADYLGPCIFTLVVLSLAVFLWAKGRKNVNYRIVFFGLGWFFIALFPYLNIAFKLNACFSEHWLYLPELGLILAVVCLGLYWSREAWIKGIFVCICIFWTAWFSYLTIEQNKVWKDEPTFYAYTIKTAPYSWKAYNNLGCYYLDQGEIVKAKELFEKALEIYPDCALAKENLQGINSRLGIDGQ